MPTPIRVLLADDHPIVRGGIRNLLTKAGGIEIVGEAQSGAEALHLVAALRPDVLVLDMEMPDMTGLDVARRLQADGTAVRILALSGHDDEQFLFGLLESGASGYLTKDEEPDAIIEAVRGVARGEEGWVSRRVAAKLVRRRRAAASADPDALTPREHEVLTLVARGLDNAAIADALALAEGTVKNHLTRIYDKLGLHTRAEAVAWAWQSGMMG